MRPALSIAIYMIVPILVMIYTINFGRWVARQGNRWGAWGLYALALVTLVVPFVILLIRVPG